MVMAWSVGRLKPAGFGRLSLRLHALKIDLFLRQQGLDTTTSPARRCLR